MNEFRPDVEENHTVRVRLLLVDIDLLAEIIDGLGVAMPHTLLL